jgi:hypothetical protein
MRQNQRLIGNSRCATTGVGKGKGAWKQKSKSSERIGRVKLRE